MLSTTQLFVTQTYLDEDMLYKTIAYNYFQSHTFQVNGTEENLQEKQEKNWQEKINNSSILTVNFQEKSDLKDYISNLYINYNKPTLLFLGNLSRYSLPLQEGMLKLLEEPPINLTPIITTFDLSDILATIVSRSHINYLRYEFILKYLDQDLLKETQAKLPSVNDFIKNFIKEVVDDPSSSFSISKSALTSIDTKTTEREHLDFWLWQLQIYCQKYYLQNPIIENQLKKFFFKILETRKLNKRNLQKRLVLSNLFT
jgi:hypothetical protein